MTFLAIVGPGLIVMVGDNDAGGVATYAQAGQNYGYSLLWVLLLLIPVLIVNQEMVVRLGAVTGVGHAKLIFERFGRFWGLFSVVDLFLLNFLTIVTEFIGISLAMSYFGVSPYLSVPIAAAMLIGITASGSFRRWERAMFAFIAASIILFVPLVIFSHPHVGSVASHFVVPGIRGGVSSNAVLLIIAIVGTTVAPWQLFFQQSNVIDKRITPRFIRYERADTVPGIAGGRRQRGHHPGRDRLRGAWVRRGPGTSRTRSASLMRSAPRAASWAPSSLWCSSSRASSAPPRSRCRPAMRSATCSTSSTRCTASSATRRPSTRAYTLVVVLAAGIVLVPGAPLGLLTTAVQALAGVLLPSASVFLLLLCNDPEVLGPWTNARWLNVVAGIIIGLLLMLSGTLVVTTLFAGLSAPVVVVWIAGALAAGSLLAFGWLRLAAGRRPRAAEQAGHKDFAAMSRAERSSWRMPPLALLKPVTWSPVTKLTVAVMYGYLVISVLLLIVKAIQLGTG